MTEQTSGPKSSEQRLREATEDIEKFAESLGLPSNERVLSQIKADATRFIELSLSGKRQMSGEECFEAYAVLSQYAMCLHRECQRQDAIANWCAEQVGRIIAPSLKQQTAWGTKERWLCAVMENEAVGKYESYRVRAESYHKELSYLPMRIEKIAEGYSQLGNAKQRERKFS